MMLQVAFAGTFPMRRHLATPCEIVAAGETGILPGYRTSRFWWR
jgi:hypothetical protein